MKPMELIEQGRFLGEEFLLWLWMQSQMEGGASGVEGDGSACFVDDAIQLVSERGEVKEISLRKGSPSESREAFEALSRGMRPARMKLRILSGDMEWVFSLSAATLDMGTLKLPPSTGKAPQDRLHDRLYLLEEGAGHLERRLQRFLEVRAGAPADLLATMKAWVRAGLAGAGGDAPWEA